MFFIIAKITTGSESQKNIPRIGHFISSSPTQVLRSRNYKTRINKTQ